MCTRPTTKQTKQKYLAKLVKTLDISIFAVMAFFLICPECECVEGKSKVKSDSCISLYYCFSCLFDSPHLPQAVSTVFRLSTFPPFH